MLAPLLLALAALPALPALPRPAADEERAQAWIEDALFVADALERLHPAPYSCVPRAELEASLDAFAGGVDGWSDERALLELARIVASVSRCGGDGHTALWPRTAGYLPVQLYCFEDGWFVVAATGGHEGLVGARLVALDGVGVEDACARAAPFLSKDNDLSLRLRLGLALTAPALLDAAGVGDGGALTLRVARDGAERDVLVEPETRSGIKPWGGAFSRSLPPWGERPWTQEREAPFRAHVLERALYVEYNVVLGADERGTTIAELARGLGRTFEEQGLERIVIDARWNAGGDSSTFAPLLDALRSGPANRRGALYLLVGRGTFSAGGNFAAALRASTAALLVGEPPGGAPNHFGDASELELPHHAADAFLRVSTRVHEYAAAGAPALVLEPDLAAPLSSVDYFAGRDPALERALSHRE